MNSLPQFFLSFFLDDIVRLIQAIFYLFAGKENTHAGVVLVICLPQAERPIVRGSFPQGDGSPMPEIEASVSRTNDFRKSKRAKIVAVVALRSNDSILL